MTQNAATPHARLVVSSGLLLKAAHHHAGMYQHGAGYYLLNGRWRKLHKDKPAPKGAPVAAHPKAGGDHQAVAHFTQEQWAALKLPEDNVNAGSHNKKIDHIKELSEGGHVTGLLGLGIGSNTYGKKQALVINHLLGLHGSAHKVTAGQKAGEHPAVQSAPAEPHPTGLPEHLAPKTTPDLQEPGPLAPLAQHVKDTLDEKAAEGDVEFIKLVAANNPEHPQIVAYAQQKLAELDGKAPAPAPVESPAPPAPSGPLAMPAFDEGKTTTGVVDYHKKVAQKIIDHGHAGNASVLEDMKADGLKPNAKGKTTNTWLGKTANSKKLLALHAAALAHAAGGAAPAADDGPKDGDTKPAADGGTLVLKDGHWVKQGGDADEHGELPPVLAPVSDPAPAAAAWNTLTTDQKASILAVVSPLYTTGYTGKPNAAAKKMAAAGWGALTDQVKSKVTPYISMHAHAKQEAAAKPAPVMPEKPVAAESVADKGQSPLKTIGGITFEAVKSGAVWKVKVAGTDKLIDGIHSDSKGGLWSKLNQHHGSVGADSFASEFGGKTETPLSPQQLQNLQSIPWFKLKLPAENTNAKSHNAALAKIEAMAFAGDTAGLQAFIDAKAGAKQTYTKKQVLTAQTALAGLGTPGATAAVPVEPAPEPANPHILTEDQEVGLLNWMAAGKPTSNKPGSWSKLWGALPAGLKAELKSIHEATASKAAATTIDPEQKQVLDELASGEHWVDLEDLAEMHGPGTQVHAYAQKLLTRKPTPEQMDAAAAPAAPTPKAPAKVKVAGKVYENTLNGHNKFWAVSTHGSAMKTTYGKIGTKGQETVKHFPSEAAAQTAAAKLTAEKKAKGYNMAGFVEHEHDAPGGPTPAAQPQGPKEGDTKQGADGMLVLKDGHWVKMGQGAKALTLWDVNNFKATAAGYSKQVFTNVLKPAAMAGDAAAIQKWKDANAGKMPNTQKLADKLLEAMGHVQAAPAGDTGNWKYSASDPGMSGYPSLSSDVGMIAWNAEENQAEFHFDFEDEPAPIIGNSLPDLLKKMVAAGYEAPPLAAMQKLDSGFKASDIPAKPAASAQPAAFTMAANGLPSMDAWAQVGPQGGSNPGGKFKDPTGQEWYCKFPGDEATAKSEVLAAKLYGLAGLSGQDAILVSKGGKVGIATKWVDIKKAPSAAALAKVDGVHSGFAVDAWLGNWDVVGMSLDNLQIGPDGKAHRVDAGGSLEYRAQGAKKPFGTKVEEIDTLRDVVKNPHAAAVFAKMTKADIVASVAKVAAISDVTIRAMVNQYGPGTQEEKAKLADTLIARKADLLKRYPQAAKKKKAIVFDPSKVSAPPSFLNWGGSGKSGPSSKEFLNKANEEAAQAIYQAAKTGSLDAIKSLQANVYDKDTGVVVGSKPVLEHPSQHIKGYAQQVINEINYQMNPPKRFRFDGGHPLHSLNAAYPAHHGAPSSAAAQKLGKYIVLGTPGTVKLEDLALPPKITHSSAGGSLNQQTYSPAAQAAIAKMPATQQQAVQSYTGSSYHAMNNSLWAGNPTGAAKSAGEALKTLGHDIAPGTVLSRKINLRGADLEAMLASSGKILQEPAIMSTSIRPSSWSGNVQLKLHVGPGVKGLWVGPGSKPGGGALSKHASEDEMILPPGARMLIMSVKKGPDSDGFGQHGSHIIEAVILPT